MQGVIVIFFVLFLSEGIARNNVCKNWRDYWRGNKDSNPNCFYNPDMYLDSPDLLEKYYGYFETHEIPTTDGYTITTFRVPRNNSRGIVLLRHPATADSIFWIGLGTQAPGYYFWKNGFELWMTNTRGTKFSRKHVNLTVNDYEYWNFSYHEIGLFDLRASLKYIYKYSNKQKVIVIGHSMACTESLIYASLYPKESQKLVEIFILINPVAGLKHFGLVINNIIPLIERIIDTNKIGYVYGDDQLFTKILHNVCSNFPDICLTFVLIGKPITELSDPTLAAVVFKQLPRSVSLKNAKHYGQLLTSGKFRFYDYGERNIILYKKKDPPEYPLERIMTPIYLVYGDYDTSATPEDVEELYRKLPRTVKKYGKLKIPGYNHFDIALGKRKEELMFDKINKLLSKM